MEDKIIDNQLYRHYSLLHKWEKNEAVTTITEDNWLKLIASIEENGVIDPVKPDDNNMLLDGNHREDAVRYIVEVKGITHAANGREIAYLPIIQQHPQTEAERWKIALLSHSEYRSWNADGLANFIPEFENDVNLSLINISFEDPKSFPNIGTEHDLPNDPTPEKEKKTTQCPSCGHVFVPELK